MREREDLACWLPWSAVQPAGSLVLSLANRANGCPSRVCPFGLFEEYAWRDAKIRRQFLDMAPIQVAFAIQDR